MTIMTRIPGWVSVACASLAVATASLSAQTIAITGGKVHPVSGPVIENGTVLVRDGKIVAVGSNIAIPADAQRIDAKGKWVTPGIVNATTSLGLTEIGAVDVSNDIREIGDFNPNVRAEVAVNAESRHIGTTRSASPRSAPWSRRSTCPPAARAMG